MARGQIGKPEFFVDYFLWLNTVGSLNYNDIYYDGLFNADIPGFEYGTQLISSMLRLDPNVASPLFIRTEDADYSSSGGMFSIPTGLKSGHKNELGESNATADVDYTDYANLNINYIAFLNHNFNTAQCFPRASWGGRINEDGEFELIPDTTTEGNFWPLDEVIPTEIINFNDDILSPSGGMQGYEPYNDGYSVFSFAELDMASYNIERFNIHLDRVAGEISFSTGMFLGAVSVGHKYSPPSSPDMKINMTYDVGYKRKNTISGGKTSTLNWFREKGWSQLGTKRHAFNLEDQRLGLSHRFNFRKSGRRVWDIQFSYVSDDDMFPTNINTTVNGMSSVYGDGDPLTLEDNGVSLDTSHRTLMGDNSMIAQLLHKTCFGYLPFMFRPDSTYSKADAFCLAMLDMKKFKIRQVAHKLWSVKMRVTEVI